MDGGLVGTGIGCQEGKNWQIYIDKHHSTLVVSYNLILSWLGWDLSFKAYIVDVWWKEELDKVGGR